jgi:hypothetical protein
MKAYLDEGLWMKDEGLFVGVVSIKLSSFFHPPFFHSSYIPNPPS